MIKKVTFVLPNNLKAVLHEKEYVKEAYCRNPKNAKVFTVFIESSSAARSILKVFPYTKLRATKLQLKQLDSFSKTFVFVHNFEQIAVRHEFLPLSFLETMASPEVNKLVKTLLLFQYAKLCETERKGTFVDPSHCRTDNSNWKLVYQRPVSAVPFPLQTLFVNDYFIYRQGSLLSPGLVRAWSQNALAESGPTPTIDWQITTGFSVALLILLAMDPAFELSKVATFPSKSNTTETRRVAVADVFCVAGCEDATDLRKLVTAAVLLEPVSVQALLAAFVATFGQQKLVFSVWQNFVVCLRDDSFVHSFVKVVCVGRFRTKFTKNNFDFAKQELVYQQPPDDTETAVFSLLLALINQTLLRENFAKNLADEATIAARNKNLFFVGMQLGAKLGCSRDSCAEQEVRLFFATLAGFLSGSLKKFVMFVAMGLVLMLRFLTNTDLLLWFVYTHSVSWLKTAEGLLSTKPNLSALLATALLRVWQIGNKRVANSPTESLFLSFVTPLARKVCNTYVIVDLRRHSNFAFLKMVPLVMALLRNESGLCEIVKTTLADTLAVVSASEFAEVEWVLGKTKLLADEEFVQRLVAVIEQRSQTEPEWFVCLAAFLRLVYRRNFSSRQRLRALRASGSLMRTLVEQRAPPHVCKVVERSFKELFAVCEYCVGVQPYVRASSNYENDSETKC